MTQRAFMRALGSPGRVYSRLRGARPPVRTVISDTWARLLVSFRSPGPVDSAGTTPASLVDRGLRVAVFRLARAYAQVVRRVSASHVFMPTDQIEWVSHLESNWRVIRDELDCLRAAFDLPAMIDVIPGEQGMADARWKAFMFRYFGHSIAPNCSICPRTAALLENIPGLLSAEFSVLEPGTRLAAHHGIYAGVLRYHLGLIVPERADLCGLRVDNETRQWREGASLLFDDTRQHEAWNLANQDRVVLIVDVKRQLPAPLRWLNEAVLLVLSRIVMPPLVRADQAVPRAPRAATLTAAANVEHPPHAT